MAASADGAAAAQAAAAELAAERAAAGAQLAAARQALDAANAAEQRAGAEAAAAAQQRDAVQAAAAAAEAERDAARSEAAAAAAREQALRDDAAGLREQQDLDFQRIGLLSEENTLLQVRKASVCGFCHHCWLPDTHVAKASNAWRFLGAALLCGRERVCALTNALQAYSSNAAA